MKVAIVGASEKHWSRLLKQKAIEYIYSILFEFGESDPNDMVHACRSFDGVVLVSGSCPKGGVDIWAEQVADEIGIEKIIFKPEVNQWKDEKFTTVDNIWDTIVIKKKGYKSRNIQIAEECDVLFDVEPNGKKWGGGMWTMNKAKELGKEVHQIFVGSDNQIICTMWIDWSKKDADDYGLQGEKK